MLADERDVLHQEMSRIQNRLKLTLQVCPAIPRHPHGDPTAHGWPRQPRVCREVLAMRLGGYRSTWSSMDHPARPSVRGGTVSTESALRAARGRTGGGVADNATQHAHVAQRRPHTPVSNRCAPRATLQELESVRQIERRHEEEKDNWLRHQEYLLERVIRHNDQ